MLTVQLRQKDVEMPSTPEGRPVSTDNSPQEWVDGPQNDLPQTAGSIYESAESLGLEG